MERIAGINDVRPGLTSYIEAAKGGTPVVITVNSEPQAVLVGYNRYRELEKASEDNKRLALGLALANLRARAASASVAPVDVDKEIRDFRKQHENRS